MMSLCVMHGVVLVLLLATSLRVVAYNQLQAHASNVMQCAKGVAGIQTLEVTFVHEGKDYTASCGTWISPAAASVIPFVQWPGAGDAQSFYTLVLVDLDAPSPQHPSSAQWRHWVVADIRGHHLVKPTGERFREGDLLTLTPFQGPTPPAGSGQHRYVFHLYQQPKRAAQMHPRFRALSHQRAHFSVAKFAAQYGLQLRAVNYFNSSTSGVEHSSTSSSFPTGELVTRDLSHRTWASGDEDEDYDIVDDES